MSPTLEKSVMMLCLSSCFDGKVHKTWKWQHHNCACLVVVCLTRTIICKVDSYYVLEAYEFVRNLGWQCWSWNIFEASGFETKLAWQHWKAARLFDSVWHAVGSFLFAEPLGHKASELWREWYQVWMMLCKVVLLQPGCCHNIATRKRLSAHIWGKYCSV